MLICGQHLKVRPLADPALCCCCGDSKIARLYKRSRKGFSVSMSISCQPSCPFCIRTGGQCACVTVKHQFTTYSELWKKTVFLKGPFNPEYGLLWKKNLRHYFKDRAGTIYYNSFRCLILDIISGFDFAFLTITQIVIYPKLNISILFNAFQI